MGNLCTGLRSVSTYAEDVCFIDANLDRWENNYLKLKCTSNGAVNVSVYNGNQRCAGTVVPETYQAGEVITRSGSACVTFVCQDVYQPGDITCVPASVNDPSQNGGGEILSDGQGSDDCGTSANSYQFPAPTVFDLPFYQWPATKIITGVLLTSCPTCPQDTGGITNCTPAEVTITSSVNSVVVDVNSLTVPSQEPTAQSSLSGEKIFIPFSSLGLVDKVIVNVTPVVPWYNMSLEPPSNILVSVEELSVCVQEQSTPHVGEWSTCAATCGTRFEQQRVAYCQGNDVSEDGKASFKRRNIYPQNHCQCNDCETTQLCIVPSFDPQCIDTTFKVSNLVANSGDQTVSITWDDPGYTGTAGASAVTQWLVFYDAPSLSQSADCSISRYCTVYDTEPEQPLQLTGPFKNERGTFNNDLEYRISVQIRNDLSMLSETETDTATPKALDRISLDKENVVAGDTQVVVSWNMPTYHGSRIVHFEIRVNPNSVNLNETRLTTDTSMFTVPNLVNGIWYTIDVRYINADDIWSGFGGQVLVMPRGSVRWVQANDACSGKCGYGMIARYGSGDPDCVDEDEIKYPSEICLETLKKDTDCTRLCPPAPLTVSVDETYSGAVSIAWGIVESGISDDPVEWYYVVVNFGEPDSIYQKTNLTTAVVQGLENGKRYTFQVRSMTKNHMQSDLSAKVYANPSDKLDCFGGCNADGGRCKYGICWCWSGWYGSQCEHSWLLEITSPLESETRDMRITCGTADSCGDGYAWPIYWELEKNISYDDEFQTSASPTPDVLLFLKAECEERGDKFCLPKYVAYNEGTSSHVNLPLNEIDGLSYRYPWTLEPEGLGLYYATVFVSPSLQADTTAHVKIEYNLAWCNGKISGKIEDIEKGEGICTVDGIALEHSWCKEHEQECECYPGRKLDITSGECVQISSCYSDCGVYGECVEGQCKCVEGFRGPNCEYGPQCKLRCKNGGIPEGDENEKPSVDCENEKCKCDGNWEGDFCERCGISCANGGRADAQCYSCNCPAWYDESDTCLIEHQKISIKLNLKPDSYLLDGGGEYSLNRLAKYVKKEAEVVFERNQPTRIQGLFFKDAVPNGRQIEIKFTIPKGTDFGTTPTDTITKFRLLVENVKSEWYTHYILSNTDPASFKITQRVQPQSELSAGSQTYVISQSIILVAFLMRLM